MTLHSKTRNEVAAELGICTKTLRRWLALLHESFQMPDFPFPKEVKQSSRILEQRSG